MTAPRNRLIWQLGAALIASVVVIAALILAVVAITRSSTVGSCVNDALGDRNGLTKQASVNTIRNEKAQQTFLRALLSPDMQVRLNAYAAYQHEHDQYVRVLVQIQRARDARPLGTC